MFIWSSLQAPLVSPGQRVCLAILEEKDKMGLLACLEVLGDLDPKVRKKNNNARPHLFTNDNKGCRQKLTLLRFLQVCREPLVWMDLMALGDLKDSLGPQVMN